MLASQIINDVLEAGHVLVAGLPSEATRQTITNVGLVYYHSAARNCTVFAAETREAQLLARRPYARTDHSG